MCAFNVCVNCAFVVAVPFEFLSRCHLIFNGHDFLYLYDCDLFRCIIPRLSSLLRIHINTLFFFKDFFFTSL